MFARGPEMDRLALYAQQLRCVCGRPGFVDIATTFEMGSRDRAGPVLRARGRPRHLGLADGTTLQP
jgi:hypothetical protein